MGAVLLAATLVFPSVEMVDVLGSLGIVSVAVGFAFKDVLENLLAGVLLLLRDPFKSGDQIRVGTYEGVVEGITVRETLLRTHAGQRVLLPNAFVYTSPLEVLTHYDQTRVSFTVVLDPSADVPAARRVPAPDAVVTSTSAAGVALECRLWTASDRAAMTAATDVAVPAVLDALHAAGVRLDTGDVLLREHPPPPVDQTEPTPPADTRGNP